MKRFLFILAAIGLLSLSARAADLRVTVDTALGEVPVNKVPLVDDSDFKSIEGAVAYNAGGMTLRWHFVTTGGEYTVTSVTPTTGGDYDWTDQGDSGIYTIEIPASGGASINNDTEGVGWFTGVATGVLPWTGPTIEFVPANIANSLVNGTDKLEVDTTQFGGSAGTFASGIPAVNGVQISGDSGAADNLEAAFDGTGYKANLSIADVRKGYNNVLHVGSGQTYTTASAADAASASGDLIIFHAGEYVCNQLGKDNVTWRLNRGVTLVPTETNLDPLFSGSLTSFSVKGLGKVTCPTDICAGEFNSGNISIECDIFDCTALVPGQSGFITNADASLRLKANYIYVPNGARAVTNSGKLDLSCEYAEVIGTGMLFSGGIVRLAGGMIETGDNFAGGDQIDISATIVATNESTNGLNFGNGGTVVLRQGALVTTSGRPSLSGSATFIVSDAFAYDANAATATNIRHSRNQADVLQLTTIDSLTNQTTFTLTAGSADNNAYNGAVAIITDATDGQQKSFCPIDDYTGLTKTISLVAPPSFTIAATDRVSIVSGSALAPEAIGAQQLATTAVDEIQANLETNGVTLTAAALDDVNAEADTALTDYGALKPTTPGRTLDVGTSGAAEANLAEALGTPLTEPSAGRFAGNLGVFFNNDNAVTTSTLDDILTGGGGGTDWTATERNYFRWAFGIPGTQTEIPGWTPQLLSLDQFNDTLGDQATFDEMWSGSEAETQVAAVDTKLGTPAGASLAADIVTLDDFVDDLEARLTSGRAGYLDNLSAGAVAQASALATAQTGITNLGTAVADVPTVAEFEARTLAAGSYFDPSTDNVSVGAMTQAALADMVNTDTGETEAVDNSVADLSGGAGGEVTIDWDQLVADHDDVSGSFGERLSRIPNAAPGSGSGLATATNVTASTASVVDALEDLEVEGVSDFTADQQAQILAALSVTGDIGVAKGLIWDVRRIDGAIKGGTITIDPAETAEVAVRFNGVLAPGDAIDEIVSVELVDSDDSVDVDSPAFDDVGDAEVWMASAVKFDLTSGTSGVKDQVKVKVLTVNGKELVGNVFVLPNAGE